MVKKSSAKVKSSLTTNSISIDELSKLLREGLKLDNLTPLTRFKKIGICSPLIIVGEADVRIRRLYNWLRSSYFSGPYADAVSVYLGSQLTTAQAVQNVIQSCQNISLFSPEKLVIISDAHEVKAATSKLLVEGLTRPMPHTFVIVTGKSISQKTPFLREMSALGRVVEVGELRGEPLKKWITQEALRCGIEAGFTNDALELMVRFFGNNLALLSQELQKLALVIEPSAQITRQLLLQSTRGNPEHTSFELIEAISKRNLPLVVVLLENIMSQGLHPLQICAFLSKAFRVLIANAPTGGKRAYQTPSDLSNPWFIKNLRSASASFSQEQFQDALELIKELDQSLKDSKLPSELQLSIALSRLALRQPSVQGKIA